MGIALVFPPFCDPRAPQLALPSLAAFLRGAGLDVTLHDLNLSGITALCAEPRLRRTHLTLSRRLHRGAAEDLARAVRVSERLIEQGPTVLRDLRDPVHFFDPMRYADARRILEEILRTSSLASPGVNAGLFPIRYEVAGLSSASLRDLKLATAPEFDLFDESSLGLAAELSASPPDLVGITITNRQQIVPGLALARRLRGDGHFVVIGGAVFSKFRDALRISPGFFRAFADAVVVYEGETALLGLADAHPRGATFDDVPNLLYLRGSTVVATATHVEDVPSLPTPDFDGLPLTDYLTPHPVLPILTGKGCYFNRCKFCDIPYINHIARKAYRVRPADRVVDDVHALYRRHGASHFVITDEALSPRLLAELADELERRPGPFSMTGYARPEPGFTEAACKRFAGFGMRKLFFGLESGSQRSLDHMDKGIRIADVTGVLANCRAAGIDFHLFGIVGLPQETPEEARKTLDFLLAHGALIDHPGCSFDVHPFGLELRTRYFEEREAQGLALNAAALRGEFTIGVSDAHWANTAGISPAAAKHMIAAEFIPALRRTFRRWHATPDPIWPPQEEYAVLYAEHFRGRPFPWRTCIPSDERAPFTFVPSRCGFGQPRNGSLTLEGLGYSVRLPAALFSMIAGNAPLPWGAHVARTFGVAGETDARQYIEALVELGILVIRLQDAVVA